MQIIVISCNTDFGTKHLSAFFVDITCFVFRCYVIYLLCPFINKTYAIHSLLFVFFIHENNQIYTVDLIESSVANITQLAYNASLSEYRVRIDSHTYIITMSKHSFIIIHVLFYSFINTEHLPLLARSPWRKTPELWRRRDQAERDQPAPRHPGH